MKRPLIVGVMGGGTATAEHTAAAYELGRRIAQQGWILLNGGRNSGIMDASAKGAHDHGGLTIGILPDDHAERLSDHIAIPIITGLGSARNCINVLSSDVVVACPGGAGTLSEIALSLKYGKPLVLFNFGRVDQVAGLGNPARINEAETAAEVIEQIKRHAPTWCGVKP